MVKNSGKKIAAVLAVAATVAIVTPKPAYGFFVSDVVEWFHTVQNTIATNAGVAQTIKVLKETGKVFGETQKVTSNTASIYTQVNQDAKGLSGPQLSSLRGFFMSNPATPIQDQNGDASGFMAALNKGINVASTWDAKSEKLFSNPNMPPGGRLSLQYLATELRAAAAKNGATTLGTAKAVQEQMQKVINNCENSALSVTNQGSLHTAQTSRDISTACQAVAIRQAQTQLSVNTALLDMEVAREKRAIDEQTVAVNARAIDQKYRQAMDIGDTQSQLNAIVDR